MSSICMYFPYEYQSIRYVQLHFLNQQSLLLYFFSGIDFSYILATEFFKGHCQRVGFVLHRYAQFTSSLFKSPFTSQGRVFELCSSMWRERESDRERGIERERGRDIVDRSVGAVDYSNKPQWRWHQVKGQPKYPTTIPIPFTVAGTEIQCYGFCSFYGISRPDPNSG